MGGAGAMGGVRFLTRRNQKFRVFETWKFSKMLKNQLKFYNFLKMFKEILQFFWKVFKILTKFSRILGKNLEDFGNMDL